MKRIISSAICLTMLFGLASCSSDDKASSVKKRTRDTDATTVTDISTQEYELTADQNVFYFRSTNYAWGTHDSGIFIKGDGRIYSFDASHIGYNDRNSDSLPKVFEMAEKYTEPVGMIKADSLNKLYSLALSIGDDNELISESVAYDMGQRTWYFIDPDTGSETKIGSYGDNDETPTDANAKALWELLCDHDGMSFDDYEPTAIFFSPILCSHCGPINDLPAGENAFILKSKDELDHFALEFNLDVSCFADRFNNNDICYVKIINLTDKVDSLNVDGFMATADKRDFLIDNDLSYSDGDICDGYILITVFDEYQTEIREDLNGNKWVPFDFDSEYNKMLSLYNDMAFSIFSWKASQSYYEDFENILIAPGGFHKDIYTLRGVIDEDTANAWYKDFEEVGPCNADEQYLTQNIVMTNNETGTLTDKFVDTFKEYRQFDYFTVSNNTISDVIYENTGVRMKEDHFSSVRDDTFGFINAASICAEWETPFLGCTIRNFSINSYCGNETIFLDSTENVFIEGTKAQGFAKPFKGGKYSFVALLPAGECEFYNANELAASLTAQDMQYMWNNRQQKEINVSLPIIDVTDTRDFTDSRYRFPYEYSLLMGDSRCVTGVYEDFAVNIGRICSVAGFSMSVDGAGIQLRDPDETSGDFNCDMCFDHGFVYMAVENDTGLPVLLGTYNKEE